MVLLDRRFGLTTVEFVHHFDQGTSIALELAPQLRATAGNLNDISTGSIAMGNTEPTSLES